MDRTPAQEAVAAVTRMGNCFGANRVNEEFVREMLNEHRTLQQSFTRLCIKWLYCLAKEENYDLRNARSIEIARPITRALGPEEPHIPFI